MHGFSIVSELLRKIDELAEENKAGKVKEVKLTVGKHLFHGSDELTQAFEMLTKDGICEDAKLTVEEVDGNDCHLTEVVFED